MVKYKITKFNIIIKIINLFNTLSINNSLVIHNKSFRNLNNSHCNRNLTGRFISKTNN